MTAVDNAQNLSHNAIVQMAIVLSEIVAIACRKVLYKYQTPIVNAIIEATIRAEADEYFILQARQSGKTESLIIAVITLAIIFINVLKMNFHCGLFAPAKAQTIKVTRARLRERLGEFQDILESLGLVPILGDGRTTDVFIIRDLSTGKEATISSYSADKSANIKAPTLNLIIIEQIEDVDDEKMKSDIFPMGAAVAGVRVLAGTSTIEIHNEYFYDNLAVATEENTFVIDCMEASKYNPKYALFIEKEKERLGEDSLEFRAQYMLEWGTTLIHFIEDRAAFLALSMDVPPVEGIPKVAGWDVARKNDYSVVTIMEGGIEDSHVTDWWFSQGTNLEEQVHVVGKWLQERGVTVVAVDAIGIGIGVCDMFENHFPDIELIRVDMNARTQDEMFKLLDREIKTKRLTYPKTQSRARQLFLQQILKVVKKFSGRYLLVEAPSGKNSHDDFVDSLGLALWALRRAEKFEVGIESFSWGG